MNQQEIDNEIAALESVRDRVRPANVFGDNNKLAIEAQIQVLKDDLDYDDIEDLFDALHTQEAARDAIRWRDDGDELQSAGWEEIATPKE